MADYVWTFVRDATHLTITRCSDDDRQRLTVNVDGEQPRQYEFDYHYEAARFQTNMETFLLKTGWSFVGFSPERRRGRDRRCFPRIDERRRWWTDGTTALKVVWG